MDNFFEKIDNIVDVQELIVSYNDMLNNTKSVNRFINFRIGGK